MRSSTRTVLLLVGVAGLLLAACPKAGPATRPLGASAYRFDGFKLGDRYASAVMARSPYRKPCDNDPIDKRRRRFMVYGGLPCRGRTFPESTTVAFYLRYSKRDRYQQPILAFAWMGGSYFDSRSNFPLKVGEAAARADALFGKPLGSFKLRRKGVGLTVHSHRGDVHALVHGVKLVGFVVGPMPADPASEQWRGLMQMYQRYTRRP